MKGNASGPSKTNGLENNNSDMDHWCPVYTVIRQCGMRLVLVIFCGFKYPSLYGEHILVALIGSIGVTCEYMS